MHASDNDELPSAERGNPWRHWRDLLRLLVERRWLAAAIMVVVFTGTAIWTLRQTPRFQSTARIQVDMARQNILNLPDAAGTEPFYFYNSYVNTLVRELKSQTFADRVAQALAESGSPKPAGSGDWLELVKSGLDARVVKDSRLVDIIGEGQDAELAAKLANTAAGEMVKLSLERRVSAATEAVSWLTAQVADQREKLARAEGALRDYRAETRSVSLEQRQDIVVSKLKSISEALTAAEMERVGADASLKQLDETQQAGTNAPDIAAITLDPAVNAVRQELLAKRTESTALESRYRSEHPAMKQVTREVQELEAKFTKSCEEARTNIRARYTMAKAKEDGLRQALREQEEQALSLDRLLAEYDSLKRNADADRQLYDVLLTRLKETDLAGKLETNNLRVIDRAHVPLRPYKPRIVVNLGRGALAGLVLGLLGALLAHAADDRVRSITPATGSEGAKLLAVVPTIAEPDAARRARVMAEVPASAPAEAFRSLRAALLLAARGRAARRIMITGAGAGDGKSLVATNLAIALAVNGEKTLLVDADLRRPTVRRAFAVPAGHPHPLRDKVTLKGAILHTAIPNLDVLAPDGPLENPAELLGSPRLKEMLEEASAYDRIVIDSPPLFSVSDPLLLLPHVDGILLVARHKRTRQLSVQEALRSLADHGAHVFGVVLNSVAARDHNYYYSGYYHYYGGERPASDWRVLLGMGSELVAALRGRGARFGGRSSGGKESRADEPG